MLTIISMIVGFFSSLAPDFIKLFQDRSDKRHELALLEMQLKAEDNRHIYKMEEVGVGAYRDIVVAANKQQSDMLDKASKWVVNFTAIVRPLITYLFLVAFIGFKAALLFAALNPTLPWHNTLTFWQAITQVWGEEENAMVAGIFCYWFGDRTLAKRR